MTLHVVGAVARSDVGHVREDNEDAAFAGNRLLAVADGMGGHAGGEVASRVTIASVAALDEDAPGTDLLTALRDAVDVASERIRGMVQGEPDLAGMGTTLTALLVSGQRIGLAHIGDSRGYLLRDGQLTQITHDHTYVQDLIDAGRLTPEEAAQHPRRSMLLRALDGRDDVEVDLRVREGRAGDRYLLCSDGLSGVVSSETIREQLMLPTAEEAAQALVDLALRAGGPDNVTVVVADLTDDDARSAGEPQVAGAASLEAPTSPRGRASAAGRAAALTRPRRRRREQVAPDAAPARRLLRPAVIVPAALVLLGLGLLLGGRVYLDGQYYVGESNNEVVIFRGVPGSLVGLRLHHVVEHTGLASGALAEADRSSVSDGSLTTGSRSAAEAIVKRIEADAAAAAAPPGPTPGTAPASPTVTPTPPAATPSASPTP